MSSFGSHGVGRIAGTRRDAFGGELVAPSVIAKWEVRDGLISFKGSGHGIERKGTEEVAAHAGLDLYEGAGGGVNPVDGKGRFAGEPGEFGFEVKVADEARGSSDDEEEVFNEAAQGAEKADGFFLTVGAGAVTLCGVEELRVVGFLKRGAEQNERVLAAGEVSGEVEAEGATYGAFGEARGKSAVLRL